METDMTRIASRRGALAVVALSALFTGGWAATLAQAAPVSFTVPLSGGEQSPAVTTKGTGTAELTYDPASHVVTWSISYSGLSGPATMAHFHGPAGPGANAPVTIWLSKQGAPVSSPIRGEATLSQAQAEQFAAGQWYVNIHTQDHPAGEIRGQVVLPKS
jgi:hypothetical protein